MAQLCLWEILTPRSGTLALPENHLRCFWWTSSWDLRADLQPCFWCPDLFAGKNLADQANHGSWLAALETRILQERSSTALLLRAGVSNDSEVFSLASYRRRQDRAGKVFPSCQPSTAHDEFVYADSPAKLAGPAWGAGHCVYPSYQRQRRCRVGGPKNGHMGSSS